MGRGPVVLLVHGTGAATHSWGSLVPLLARRFSVVAPDLPGHGFTGTPETRRLSLPGMTEALGELLGALGVSPVLAIGHSAGAAVLARTCLDDHIAPRGLISLNGALLPLRGAAGHLFSPLAKLLAVNPLVPRLFALRAADRSVVEGLLRGTGSTLQPAAVDFYARLLRNPGHVAGALAMMANWDLRSLEGDLPRLEPALVLVVGDGDRTVPPTEAERVRALVPTAELVTLPGLGHLAHEEQPERIAELVIRLASEWGVLSAP
jgi:magnesium chelatase accessory protein